MSALEADPTYDPSLEPSLVRVVWRNTGTGRHVYFDGRVLCGTTGLEGRTEAAPCQECVAAVMTAARGIFPT